MDKRQSHEEEDQPQEAPIEEYSLEELDELTDELKAKQDAEGLVDTAHTDGSTANPQLAQEQGLVYEPPSDPPVLPSDDPQGAEIAAGYASSMEEANPDVEDLPPRVDNQDLDLEEDIATVLRNNSETGHLDDIEITVTNGIAWLRGTVTSREDIAIVQRIVGDVQGVVAVENDLELADSQ